MGIIVAGNSRKPFKSFSSHVHAINSNQRVEPRVGSIIQYLTLNHLTKTFRQLVIGYSISKLINEVKQKSWNLIAVSFKVMLMFNKSSLRLLTRSQYYLARRCFDIFDATTETESFIIITVSAKLPQTAFFLLHIQIAIGLSTTAHLRVWCW